MRVIVILVAAFCLSANAFAWQQAQGQSQNQNQSQSQAQAQSTSQINQQLVGGQANSQTSKTKVFAAPGLGLGAAECSKGRQYSFLIAGYSSYEPDEDCQIHQAIQQARQLGHPEIAQALFFRLSSVKALNEKKSPTDDYSAKESHYNKITGSYDK